MKTIASRMCMFCPAIALCLCLVFPLCLKTAAANADEVMAAKKIISVVFDDSGSMDGNKFDCANYSVQVLTALLNEQDELYITYMNASKNFAGGYGYTTVNLSDHEEAVSNIRNREMNGGGTPIDSVEAAKEVLDNASSSDPSDQFWLVIMTDGETSGNTALSVLLNQYKSQTMSNGSGLNIVYLGIGSDAVEIDEDLSSSLHSFHAPTAADITVHMAEIANLISGRIEVANVSYGADHKTITFGSEIPLYSFSLLSQQSNATVVSAETDEATLHNLRNVSVWSPSHALYGNAAVVSDINADNSSTIIPAGSYVVTFSEEVDLKQLLVQYEPAISLKAVITSGGVVVADPNQLTAGEKISVEFTPVIPGTDTKIDNSLLPAGITWSTSYTVDDNEKAGSSGTALTDVIIEEGNNSLIGTMQIPGFAPLIYEIPFTPGSAVPPHVYSFGIEADQSGAVDYLRNDLALLGLTPCSTGTDITFWITDGGVRMDKNALTDAGVSLTVADVICDDSNVTGFFNRLGRHQVKCSLIWNNDGSFTLNPKASAGIPGFWEKAGTYTVSVQLDSDDTLTDQGVFTLTPGTKEWGKLPLIIAGIIFIIYLLYTVMKSRFHGQIVEVEYYKIYGDGSAEWQNGANSHRIETLKRFKPLSLAPGAQKKKFYGFILIAEGNGIRVDTDSVRKKYTMAGNATVSPDETRHIFRKGAGRHIINQLDTVNKETVIYLSNDRMYFYNPNHPDVICSLRIKA